MKVLVHLEAIEDILDNASGVPLSSKKMIEVEELLEIIKEIRLEMPEEIKHAQWVKQESEKIIEDARKDYDNIVRDAEVRAKQMIDESEITLQAKERARDILIASDEKAKELKKGAYDYIDNMLDGFQSKMDRISSVYLGEMFNNIEKTFTDINGIISSNREEINDLAYRAENVSDLTQEDEDLYRV